MRRSIKHQYAALAHTVQPRVSSTMPTPYAWVNPTPASSSPSGPLAGKSIAIKENISFMESPTTCSSPILKGYKPPYNATCVATLLKAGAHIVGTTKMDEFGMGSQTTHLPLYYTPVHNPTSPSNEEEQPRSAGGSSGGSAAAVAEGSAWAALGTDTGGSVRLPASYCGVVGFKPSYGLVSRRGVVAYADSLDCVGVIGGNIDTVQTLFDVLSHPDENDMTCASLATRQNARNIIQSHISTLSPSSTKPLSGLRIGLPIQTNLPSPYLTTPPSLLAHLQALGATIHQVSIPSISMALPAYYVLASAEASSNLARYGGGWYGSETELQERAKGGEASGQRETGLERRIRVRTEGFGREVRKRLLAGTYALSADEFNNTYLKALYLRKRLRADYQAVFRILHPLNPVSPTPASPASPEAVDIILHPTSISTAPKLSNVPNPTSISSTRTKNSEYLQDLLTVPASLAGLPALSVPAGRAPAPDGWPRGVSLTSQWGGEEILWKVGKGVESWRET